MGKKISPLMCRIGGCVYVGASDLDLDFHKFYFHNPDGPVSKYRLPLGAIRSSADKMLAKQLRYRNTVLDYYIKKFNLSDLIDSEGNEIAVHVDMIGQIICEKQGKSPYPICGVFLNSGKPNVCTKAAGYGTAHPGKGRCKYHAPNDKNSDISYLSKFSNDPNHSLAKSIARVDKIQRGELYDQDLALRTLHALLDSVLENNSYRYVLQRDMKKGEVLEIHRLFGEEAFPKIINLLAEIRKTQKVRAEILNMLVLNPKEIRRFIDNLLSVFMRFVPRDDIADLNNALREEVVLNIGGKTLLTTDVSEEEVADTTLSKLDEPVWDDIPDEDDDYDDEETDVNAVDIDSEFEDMIDFEDTSIIDREFDIDEDGEDV